MKDPHLRFQIRSDGRAARTTEVHPEPGAVSDHIGPGDLRIGHLEVRVGDVVFGDQRIVLRGRHAVLYDHDAIQFPVEVQENRQRPSRCRQGLLANLHAADVDVQSGEAALDEYVIAVAARFRHQFVNRTVSFGRFEDTPALLFGDARMQLHHTLAVAVEPGGAARGGDDEERRYASHDCRNR